MKLIKEIYEKDLHLNNVSGKEVRYRLRKAARALIFRENKIAILKASKLNLHKLPGGGIDRNESIIQGLRREAFEETGCDIDNIHDFGVTIEYRDAIEMLQVSYVFTANVNGVLGSPIFTQKERDEGFTLLWLNVPDVITKMKNEDKPNTYAGMYIHVRDLAILQYYVRYKNKKMDLL